MAIQKQEWKTWQKKGRKNRKGRKRGRDRVGKEDSEVEGEEKENREEEREGEVEGWALSIPKDSSGRSHLSFHHLPSSQYIMNHLGLIHVIRS